jgi:hypothetical protein
LPDARFFAPEKNNKSMKYILSIVVLVLAVSAASAQATSILKNKKITQDEVPANVSSALKKDFPAATEGSWSVFFTQSLEGSSVVVTPKWYIFTAKGDHKAVVQYSPAGKLERSKGMGKDVEVVAGNPAPSSKGSN